MLSADHKFDLFTYHIAQIVQQSFAEAFHLIFPQRNPDLTDLFNCHEPLESVNQDWRSRQVSELLGEMRLGILRAGNWRHSRPKSGSGDDDKNLHEAHSCESDGATDIEQTIVPTQEINDRPEEQGQISDGKEDPQLGRAETPERDVEFSEGMSCEIRLDGKHQKCNEQADRDCWMHVAR